MDQAIENIKSASDELRVLYAIIRNDLDRVDGILRQELQSRHPFVDRLVKHGFRLGGKRLRPALVLLSGKACGELTDEHFVLAAVVEMVHTATLIHDDVLDEATLRRHLDTVNARWNNETSVLLGDYLFTRALCLVASLENAFASRVIAEAARTMCEGEMRQIETRGDYELSEARYLEIIADKTAAFCACCCRLGAHAAGADPELLNAFTRFGLNLGIAFQIVDDVLDVLGDETTTGKSLGTDLVKQKPTLPVIRLLEQADPNERDELVSILSQSGDGHRPALKPWFERFDAVAYAREMAMAYARRATEQLRGAEVTPAGQTLRQLADFIVNRHK